MTPKEPLDPHQPRARRPVEDAGIPEDAPPPARAVAPLPPPPPRRAGPRIETVLLASTAALLAAVAWPIAFGGAPTTPAAPTVMASTPEPTVVEPAPVQPPAPSPAVEQPVIQIALLLDTSSSMDGLIDQARSQLWRVVNALDSATFHGAQPRLELALYEYGNDSLEAGDGYIRRVAAFTPELDRVSEALFALSTNGGSEHAGEVIARSLDELQWSDGPGTLRVVYIAGNEAFDQGPVSWRESIERAKAKGIVVNTVLCGSNDPSWADAATLAGGRFMTIDHNAVAEYIEAPQDAEIARIGTDINGTYVGYGAEGRWGTDNQMAQDDNVGRYGAGSVVQRSLSKGSKHYRNPTWDLVDALEDGTLAVGEVERETLPEEARGMTDTELTAWVAGKRVERERLQKRLAELSREREAWLTEERARRDGEDPTRLDTAIVASITEQATAVGFTIGSKS